MREAWKEEIQGSLIFQFVTQLKRLKDLLRSINKKEYWNISKIVKEARCYLKSIQGRLSHDSIDENLIKEEKKWDGKLRELSWAKKSLAKQKSHVLWLNEGDKNIGFFFKNMKGRRARNATNGIHKKDGAFTNEKDEIIKELVNYFKNLLDGPRKTINKRS